MNDSETWLSRHQAAEWLEVNPATISNIIKEMETMGMDGIYRQGNLLRVRKDVLNDYLYHRRAIRRAQRRGA